MAYSLWFVMRAYLIYIAIPLLVSGVVLIGSGYASFGIYGVIMGALFAVGWVALIIQQITKATGAGSIFDAVYSGGLHPIAPALASLFFYALTVATYLGNGFSLASTGGFFMLWLALAYSLIAVVLILVRIRFKGIFTQIFSQDTGNVHVMGMLPWIIDQSRAMSEIAVVVIFIIWVFSKYVMPLLSGPLPPGVVPDSKLWLLELGMLVLLLAFLPTEIMQRCIYGKWKLGLGHEGSFTEK